MTSHPAKDASSATVLTAAHEAYRRRDWVTARDGLRSAQRRGQLGAEDLYVLSACLWWLGDLDAALTTMQDAYTRYVEERQPRMAALTALALGYSLATRGEQAQATGWLSRGRRLLADVPKGPEHGYLHYIDHDLVLGAGDLDRAIELAESVHEAGRRHDDPTLVALGVLGRGQVLVKRARIDEGMVLLDEAMVAATSDRLDPTWTGHIYCHLMASCHEVGDLRRAREWTAATAHWCERMPGAGPFMGICRVHRAQVLQVQAEWDTAEREVRRVCDDLAAVDIAATAEAHYVLGDLRRQQGDLSGAEAAFRAAHALGRDPQPGWALLRLAEGRADAAATSIRAALAHTGADRLSRWRLLPAAVEITVAAEQLDAARHSAEELAAFAASHDSREFAATAHVAMGTVLLAEGDPDGAGAAFRSALTHWREIGAWYEVARTHALMATALEAVGDLDTASLNRQASHSILAGESRGASAGPRNKYGGRRDQRSGTPVPGGLTAREAEVVALVAAGLSNQQIATRLVLSVRTVERHLSSAYQRLGLSGPGARTAAVGFALREGLAD